MLPFQCQAASVAPGVLRLSFFDSFTEEEFDDDNDEVDWMDSSEAMILAVMNAFFAIV